jgi:hypothetical protein
MAKAVSLQFSSPTSDMIPIYLFIANVVMWIVVIAVLGLYNDHIKDATVDATFMFGGTVKTSKQRLSTACALIIFLFVLNVAFYAVASAGFPVLSSCIIPGMIMALGWLPWFLISTVVLCKR